MAPSDLRDQAAACGNDGAVVAIARDQASAVRLARAVDHRHRGVGDDLTVVFRIRSTGRPRTNVAVVDLLPGGFEVDRDSIRNEQGAWLADYVDIREDRIVIYGSFSDRVTEIRYRVKATSPGDFIVPSAAAGSMYDRSIHASTAASRFRVSAAL